MLNSESRTTRGTVEYDQIEAFMISRGQIRYQQSHLVYRWS